MTFIIDTNVLSELRKPVERANAGVTAWFDSVDRDSLYLSVVTIAEIRRGIEQLRHRDPVQAARIEEWLARVRRAMAWRILPITEAIAEEWGRMQAPAPAPVIDAFVAATARVHGMTVITRNASDFRRFGIPLLNPFTENAPRPT